MGTWNYQGGPALLRRAVEFGATFIDTAESYGSEEIVGEALSGIRNKSFLATKASPAHFRREVLVRAAEDSLRRLKTDYIDLYQLHEPSPVVPIEETMAGMADLVEAGKVKFIGVSNFSVRQLQRAQAALPRQTIVANQVRYSLLDRSIEAAILPYCQQHGVSILAYSPLGRGVPNLRKNDPRKILPQIGIETGKSEAQIALNWCIAKPGVFALTKSNSFDRIVEDCGASGWRLSEDQMRRLSGSIHYRNRSAFEVILRRIARRVLQRTGFW
ncbi:MAG: aldo/keto reductase [Candidatus Acidiferrales bacterium]